MTDRTHPDSGRATGAAHIIRYALELGLLWIAGDGRDKVREALDALDTLEAQLESIGAGGVSGPLIGQPQAMPDLSQLTERGARAWAGVDAQGLREGFTAADMATASAQGFSDGAAYVAASVGSELVYQARYQKGFWQDSSRERHEYLQNPENTCADDWETRILYTHPAPPEGMAVTDAMIDAGKKMLHNSNGRGVREKVERIFNAMIAVAPPTAQAEGCTAEQALRNVLAAVQRYMPPDGPDAKDTLSEIIAIVDPWPLGPLEK